MSKKIGIITFHFVCNCGAVLQCQAMQTVLENMGYQAEVIDYRPKYLTEQYAEWAKIVREFKIIRGRYGTKNLKDRLHAYLSIKIWIEKNQKEQRQFRQERLNGFEEYIRRNLHLSKRVEKLSELSKISSAYDAVICGSDQIWNWLITDGDYDPAYFLEFAKPAQKAIAYAASCGVYPDAKHKNQFLKYISKLNAVSFREKSVSDMLMKKDHIVSQVVVDPTLLLGKEDWQQYETHIDVDEPYLLVYCLEPTEQFRKVVVQVQNTLQIGIANISPNQITFPHEVFRNKKCLPGEFLYLINHAKFIVSNSFHAAVFSIIFEKQMACIAHSKTGSRMVDLLYSVGLEGRILKGDHIKKSIFESIEYAQVRQKVAQQVEQSMTFLTTNLESKQS